MPITITQAELSTQIIIGICLVALLLGFRKTQHQDLLPTTITQELKGLGMLSIIFAHISYMLVTNKAFLYPLSIASGVGVDLFLFMSGYGLTVTMLKKPMQAIEFYKRRMIKVFIPFWIVLTILLAADATFLDIHYSAAFIQDSLPWFNLPDASNTSFWQNFYIIQSYLGLFPRASGFEDINSPFWYITWMLMFYVLFPLFFCKTKPWLTALLLAVIANTFAITDPLHLQVNWLHHLHTNAFSLGILLAWALSAPNNHFKKMVDNVLWFRNKSGGIGRYCIIVIAGAIAAFSILNSSVTAWPIATHYLETIGINAGYFIGQTASLIAMLGLIIAFSMKRLDNKTLAIFGLYSYETYLIHWPLLSRYDYYFSYLPAWLAVIAWLLSFLIIGFLLQKITQPIGQWIDKKF